MQDNDKENRNEIMGNWEKTPVVSIKCLAYNHEKYIADALDSFLMQKTTFPFEIIVHDDASKDRTASIISNIKRLFHILLSQSMKRKINIQKVLE